MDCPTCEAMFDAYVDGELTLTETADFERALESCPDCRRRLETARALRGLLRELPQQPAPDLLRARVERDQRAMALASLADV
jgi:anti-sigma factor RsiW